METLLSFLQSISEIFEVVSGMLGFSPVYLLPVFVIVAILASLFNVRERFPKFKNVVLGVLPLLVGCAVIFLFEDLMTWKEYLSKGAILGSISALTYQIFKPVFLMCSAKLLRKVREKTGEKVSEDKDLFT